MASNALTDSADGFFRGGQPLTWRAYLHLSAITD
jgi:hypothetical protein